MVESDPYKMGGLGPDTSSFGTDRETWRNFSCAKNIGRTGANLLSALNNRHNLSGKVLGGNMPGFATFLANIFCCCKSLAEMFVSGAFLNIIQDARKNH